MTLATLQSKKWDIHMDADSNFRISELMNLPTEDPRYHILMKPAKLEDDGVTTIGDMEVYDRTKFARTVQPFFSARAQRRIFCLKTRTPL